MGGWPRFSRNGLVNRFGRELASAIVEGRLDLSSVAGQNDDDAKHELTQITGIGSWTADIYLLRALGRADIWPQGDRALEVALQRLNGWKTRPTAEKLRNVSSRCSKSAIREGDNS